MGWTDVLGPGEIGFLTASIKQVRDTRVGDTITHERGGCEEPLPGFQPAQPVVFCGLFPVDNAEFEDLREAIEKLALNDASFSFTPQNSPALGFGFRCGFLGLLHMEIIQERLEREYDLDLITTAPTVVYQVLDTKGEIFEIHNPSDLPEVNFIEELREPIISANILVPEKHVGAVIKLCIEKRGVQKHLRYLGSQVSVEYEMPLAEVVLDFFDRLKSVSRGFASFDYHFERFEAAG